MIGVLFVCTGNICRSPMAEGVFQHLVEEAGLRDKIKVDSAGTISYHAGETAHRGTLKELAKHHIAYHGRSRPLNLQDFETFNYILAMDHENMSAIQSRKPANTRATIRMFLDYAQETTLSEVPDPYYSGGFDRVYKLVENAARGLLEAIREEYGL